MLINTHTTTNKALKQEKIYIRCHMSEWQDDWPLHTHDGFELYFFIEGNASFIIGDDIYPLKPGDTLLFSGKVLHQPNPSKDNIYIRSYINFTAEFIQDLVSEDMLQMLVNLFQQPNGLLIRWNENEFKEVDALIRQIYKEREKEASGYDFMMRSLLVHLLLKIYRNSKEVYPLFTGQVQTQKESNVRRILQHVNRTYKDPLNLESIADAMHLNKYYMCHCFKEITGHTINNYLARKRVEEAKRLLRTTNEPVGQLSDQLGFSNSIHFSRLFKQHVGVSPQGYRKLNLNE
jgi:YesN/AraC family two-component response regulator